MNLGLLVALENADKILSYIQLIFNTGPYGDPLSVVRSNPKPFEDLASRKCAYIIIIFSMHRISFLVNFDLLRGLV